MITKKEAILIIQTFATAAKFDIDNNCYGDSGKIGMIRSALFRGLDDFYYEAISLKLRDQFREESVLGGHGESNARDVFLQYARNIVG